ncbi:MAG: hypothetical protein RMJ56_11220 [Gemmataceae bacterium]|nr:hypothetical protein [Gemmata sp.]MDW8198160.1 hypothetical protein [Gemmataceae bacterium]
MNWSIPAWVVLTWGLFAAVGCNNPQAPTPSPSTQPADSNDDDHEHGEGPHGGTIFDFGKYHGEFRPDHGKKEATIWLFGVDQKTPVRVKAEKLRLIVTNTEPPIEVDLRAADPDAEGKAHQFTGQHDGFAQEMEYKGTVTGVLDGKPYSGEFAEKPAKK